MFGGPARFGGLEDIPARQDETMRSTQAHSEYQDFRHSGSINIDTCPHLMSSQTRQSAPPYPFYFSSYLQITTHLMPGLYTNIINIGVVPRTDG
jgi:hypothetical protein